MSIYSPYPDFHSTPSFGSINQTRLRAIGWRRGGIPKMLNEISAKFGLVSPERGGYRMYFHVYWSGLWADYVLFRFLGQFTILE